MVDTHLHIESTMVTPPSYARAVLPFGTTSIVIDPHEIGNVMGQDGVAYMLRAVDGIETAGARFDAAAVAEMLTWERVVGVAELMDYPGIVRQNDHIAAIVEAGLAAGTRLEGHAPLLSGRELNGYLAAGVDSEHESRDWPEMVEKLRLGMWVYGRENTFRKSAADLARALREVPAAVNVAMCTDDIDPADLLENGHLDRGLRILIRDGVPPARAIRYATLEGARRYGLHDLGAIAPGRLADVVLLESLEEVRARTVLSGGRVVVREGRLAVEIADPAPAPIGDSVRIGRLDAEAFTLARAGAEGDHRLRVIAMDQRRTTRLEEATLPFRGGRLGQPLPDDLVLLSVVPRHGQPHRPSLALLRGLNLTRGAIATTVAHDSHNLIVAGKTPEEMLAAVRIVAEMGGGAALVAGGELLARVRLPVAGLMSADPVEVVAAEVRAFNERGRELGLWATSPVLAISSLALSVAPFVRITDFGVVDVLTQEFVEMFLD
jgi:adenine deaminase